MDKKERLGDWECDTVVGKAVVVGAEKSRVPERFVRKSGTAKEVKRFKAALAATRSGDRGWLSWLAQSWGAESVLLRRDDPLPAVRQFGETVRSSLARVFHPGES